MQSLVKSETDEQESPSPTKVCGPACPAEPTWPTEPQDDQVETQMTVPAEIPERNENLSGVPMEQKIVSSEEGTAPTEAEVYVPDSFPWREEDDFQNDDDDDEVQHDDAMKDGQTPASGEVATNPGDQQVLLNNPPVPEPHGRMAAAGIRQPDACLQQDPGRTTEQGGAGQGDGVEKTVPSMSMPPPPVPTQTKRPRGDSDPYFETLSIPPPILSENAIYNRLYRVFKPKKDGTYDVDEKWVKAWQDVKDGRSQLYSMFEKTGYSVDRGFKKTVGSMEPIGLTMDSKWVMF